MGIRSSPHGCTKMEMLSEELARGEPGHPDNPFGFDFVRLNLPGADQYSPALPWVSKVVSATGRIAADVKTYMDDKRVMGPTAAACRLATRWAASILSYLGMQDACRKRVPASQRAGAWVGSVCHADQGRVTVMVTVDKWTKARNLVLHLLDVSGSTNVFYYKSLESSRGFLIYIVRRYPAFNPCLKGFHLTIDSWRPGRRSDGWKDVGEFFDDPMNHTLQQPPSSVTGVPRLNSDLKALAALFQPLTPPRRTVRGSSVAVVLYGYADASRSGFGSSFITPQGLQIRYGLWGRDISHQSSNFRELQNLADVVEWELIDQFPILQEAVNAIDHWVTSDTDRDWSCFYSLTTLRRRALFTVGHLLIPDCLTSFCSSSN
jgi:hypothetical protein